MKWSIHLIVVNQMDVYEANGFSGKQCLKDQL
jgi:hypothetical protein